MKTILYAMPRAARRLPRPALIGLGLFVSWLVIAMAAPVLAPHSPSSIVSAAAFDGSSTRFWLGTDHLGRDVLSRVLYGARVTVLLALAATVLATVVGAALGLFAVVAGRYADALISRVMDALMSVPSKMLALVAVAALGASTPLLLFIATVCASPGSYRLSRALATDLQQQEYVQVARLRGEPRAYIACIEILPNMVRPMLADAGMRFVSIVLLFSGLGFLGLGVQPPSADLGSLVHENIAGLGQGAIAALAPALAIAPLTVGVTLLIDGLSRHGRHAGGRR